MNPLKYLFIIIFLLAGIISCKKTTYDDVSFVSNAAAPQKISAMFNITQDNSGLVTITPNGEGVTAYEIFYGDTNTVAANVIPGKNIQHQYAEGVYNVKVVGHGINGKTTEATQQLTVSFRAPENLEVSAAIDLTNPFQVNVSAKATYETYFKVYFGDVANEVPQSMLEGQTLSHVYAGVGDFTITVVALSGGAATTTFTKKITIVDPVLLPLTFESPTVNYAFTNFGGGLVTVVDNPQANGINTSAKVAKMVKYNGEVYGGSFISISKPIDFSSNKIFRMKVYSPRVGAKVLLKVENASDNTINFQKEVLTTVANTWEDLAFDFSAIDLSKSYQHIVLIFDNGIKGDGSANYTWLFDDIRLTNQLPGGQINLPVTFDDPNINYAVTDFGNNVTVDATDPVNASNKVKKTTKPNGAQTWAGTTIGTALGFATPIPLTASASKMSMKVYSPAAGIHVRLKVEDHTDPTKSVETEALATVANTWETLIFDFSNQATGTAPFNAAYTYDKASVFFDFGNAGSGKVFYWDDVKFVGSAVNPGLGLPIDFESTAATYKFTDFNGGHATIVNNPNKSGINTSNQVGQMIKGPGGEVYGGSFLTLANPIDFSSAKTFKMKVYSPKVGTNVLLKVENLTDGSISYEKNVSTTTANTWEELTFDYSAINTSKSYQKIVLIFDLGTVGDGTANFTYFFDDITLN